MFIPPIDHKANFESDVWNAFHAMGLGHLMLKTGDDKGPYVYAIRSKEEQANFPIDLRIMELLIEKGLAKETTKQARDKVDNVYVLTDAGRRLFEEMETYPDSEKLEMFISTIDLQYERDK